ncbi:hypothetical protein CPB84DRAFT_1857570 [Gymnopilus junonius]|uniref:Uncharacterized protein n=1 Tax=Gymnopilus junonius TaxID=109634 RepID=A0A9P5N6Q1_GYMJU|nr:hypothetical protein CPB84DRAFT_1857570 [Gymnopilus junonius]
MVNRWSKDDPKQGSAFHELVILPTVAPQLARPYHLPGTPEFHAAQAELAHQSATVAPTSTDVVAAVPSSENQQAADESSGAEVSIDELLKNHDFYVLVTLEWTERIKTVRSSRPKKMNESKNTPDVVKVLTMTHPQFVMAALTAHGYQQAYIPGPTSAKVILSISSGGKARAPIVQDDTDWNMAQVQLRDQVRHTRGKLNAVCVIFDLDSMEGFKNRKRHLSPTGLRDADQLELIRGTHVPSMEAFSPDQVALGRAIEEIKEVWSCDKHGVCYIMKDASHVELNRFRLGAFGAAVVAGQCVANGAPPPGLLQAWAGPQGTIAAPAAKVPRGRSGPVRSSSEGVLHPATTDPTALLLSTVVPMVTMMAQQTMSSAMNSKRSHQHPSPPSSLPPSSPPPSSSPPAIEDELELCLESFGQSRGISEELIEKAFAALKAENYSPAVISETTLAIGRL